MTTAQEGLRIAPPCDRAGLTSLLISYRDDLGAPQQPGRPHHLGQTEWNDLQAAARYALAHGANRLVLVGYSMGGALITQFMERSRLAGRVSALVSTPRCSTGERCSNTTPNRWACRASSPLPVEWAIDARTDADWDSLDALEHPEDFHLPILLFHSTEDERRPDRQPATSSPRSYRTGSPTTASPMAGHTESWNVDPRLYERRLERFLAQNLTSTALNSPDTIEPDRRGRARMKKNRRRPTLPGGCPPSTIGAERLNCSVRNGKRCFPFAMHHRKFCETAAPVELENRTRPQW